MSHEEGWLDAERKCVCGHDILTHKQVGESRSYCLELCKCREFWPVPPLVREATP